MDKWGGVNLPLKNKSFNRNLFKSFSIPFFIFSMFVSSNVFANKCENLLNKEEEKLKKELMNKYGESWEKIVVLARTYRLGNGRGASRIDAHKVNNIEACKKDINYLDNIKNNK